MAILAGSLVLTSTESILSIQTKTIFTYSLINPPGPSHLDLFNELSKWVDRSLIPGVIVCMQWQLGGIGKQDTAIMLE